MSVIDDRRGEEVLLSLIYPTMVEDMSTAQQTEFAAAAEEQLEYMMGGGGNVQSEELGDARVTYCREGSIICGGERICPTSAARLMKCGLLNRWI